MSMTANELVQPPKVAPPPAVNISELTPEEANLAEIAKLQAEMAAEARENEALVKLQACAGADVPLSVVVAHDAKHPKLSFVFHSDNYIPAADKQRALVVTEHCDGARFCEELFAHFVLPNGRLAHFYFHVRRSFPPPVHVDTNCPALEPAAYDKRVACRRQTT